MVLFMVMVFGCSGLILRDQDTGWEKTQKVLGRVGLGVLSVGFSEVALYDIKAMEAEQARLDQTASQGPAEYLEEQARREQANEPEDRKFNPKEHERCHTVDGMGQSQAVECE